MPKRLIATIVTCLLATPAMAQTIEDEALAWLQDYIRVDTTNPPGNESRPRRAATWLVQVAMSMPPGGS